VILVLLASLVITAIHVLLAIIKMLPIPSNAQNVMKNVLLAPLVHSVQHVHTASLEPCVTNVLPVLMVKNVTPVLMDITRVPLTHSNAQSVTANV